MSRALHGQALAALNGEGSHEFQVHRVGRHGGARERRGHGREPVKIGMITTLSGGGSHLGIDVRDSFQLAIDQGGGMLGG